MNLREFIISRYQTSPDHWINLATAIGYTDAVNKTLYQLSASSLKQKYLGPIQFFTDIYERVDALAAHDPLLLAQLAKDWLPPNQITNKDHWWIAAWSASLRHLHGIMAIDYETIKVPAVQHEILFLRPSIERLFDFWLPLKDILLDEAPISWQAIKDALSNGGMPDLEMMRLLSLRPLSDDTISAEDICDIPLNWLRVLRGKTDRFSSSACEWLAEAARTHVVEFVFPLGYKQVIELCRELHVPIEAEVETHIIKRLLATDKSRHLSERDIEDIDPLIMPIIYILQNNWVSK